MTPMTVDRAKACGLEVQRLRKLQGMTQADLAEALEVDRGTISHIESGGRKATKIQRVAIADALHVDEEWLLNPPLPLTFQMGPQANWQIGQTQNVHALDAHGEVIEGPWGDGPDGGTPVQLPLPRAA